MTSDSELRSLAEGFLYDIYLDIGYTEKSSRRRVEELVPWADRAHFFAILDENDDVIGTIRTIHGSYGELPVGQFSRTDYSHPDPVCELSSLVVKPNHRSTGVIEHLYRAGWLDAYRAGASAIVGLIDPWLFSVFRDHYALPFVRIGEPHHYMGSDPVPVALPLEGSAYDIVARNNPDFWLWTLEAIDPARDRRAWGLPIILTDSPAGTYRRRRPPPDTPGRRAPGQSAELAEGFRHEAGDAVAPHPARRMTPKSALAPRHTTSRATTTYTIIGNWPLATGPGRHTYGARNDTAARMPQRAAASWRWSTRHVTSRAVPDAIRDGGGEVEEAEHPHVRARSRAGPSRRRGTAPGRTRPHRSPRTVPGCADAHYDQAQPRLWSCRRTRLTPGLDRRSRSALLQPHNWTQYRGPPPVATRRLPLSETFCQPVRGPMNHVGPKGRCQTRGSASCRRTPLLRSGVAVTTTSLPAHWNPAWSQPDGGHGDCPDG